MIFNEHPEVTVKQIEEMTNLPLRELQFQLKNLFHPKQRVLVKSNMKTPALKSDEKVKVNDNFKSPSLKLNFVPKMSHKKKNVDDVNEVTGGVDQEIKMERQHQLDAGIVRIMKGHKTETHTVLMQEVMRQINMFRPQPAMIKESIERLIEREYIKRDESDRSKYIYIP